MIMENNYTIGSRLKEERERLGISQGKFCTLGGVTRKTQGNYESDIRRPDADYLAAIAKAGADVLYIVTGHRTNESGETPIGAKDESGYYQDTPTSPGVLDMESLEIAVECAELHLKLMKRTVSPAKFAKLIGILYDEISQDDEDEIDDNKVIRLIDLASEEDENEQEEEMADQDKKIS